MAAQKIHAERVKEHLQELKDALAIGIEVRPATIGFHTSACAIDLLEWYLHKTGKIPLGKQVKHDWFKRPHPTQKIQPLAQRHLAMAFPHKEEIFEEFYIMEEKRNKLLYRNAGAAETWQMLQAFERLKALLAKMLQEEGEDIEGANE